MRYLGIDLHRNSFTVCIRSESGKEDLRTYSLEGISDFIEELDKEDMLAVESTGNTEHFVGHISDAVKKVVIVDPNKFEVIKKSSKKTDKNDAKALALFLSKDLLPEARMKNGLERDLSKLVKTRDKLVKQRTSILNMINNLLNSEGVNIKKESLSTQKGLKNLDAIISESKMSLIMQRQIRVLIDQVRSLNSGIMELDKDITEKGKSLKGHKNISSIKGIGDKAATILLTVIGDIEDFKDEKKLASYFGIVPRIRQSNETTHHGSITKAGSKIGRTTLVQCALVSIRYSPYLRRFYERIKKNRGSGKAIIATARKLLNIIFNTLKNGWVFSDFPNFVIA